MAYKTGKYLQQGLRGYWILIVVLAFGLLSIYTSHPTYGAPAAQSTPDVNTVPKPVKPPTPENTPFPTPTPVSDNSSGDSGNSNANNDSNDDANDDEDASFPGNENQGGSNQASSNNGSNEPAAGAGGGNASAGNANTPMNGTEQNPNSVTGVVTAVTLNLRKEAGGAAPVIDTLFLNDAVAILARNQSGDWLYICCGARTKLPGWVSKQFVSINAVNNQTLAQIPLFTNGSGQGTATVPPANTGAKAIDDALVLEMRPFPSAVWQGESVAIHFVVHNRSNQPFTGIQLRNDFPAEMAVVNAQISNQGKVSYSGVRQSGSVITVNWPTVQANSQVTATVTVQIASNVADGALIDNLAVVKTSEGAEALAGITLAMPPVALPQFREP